jgi:dipeptidyl aminopeptidase/acylaminoacyl peptidase
MKNLLTGFLVVLCFCAFAQKEWTPATMIKYKRVAAPTISPDGKRVAYVIATPEMDGEKSEFVSHVWVAAVDGSSNRQFTFGEKSCDNPQFSPDGKWLSFTSARNSEGKNQLFIISLAGGEAEQITKVKGSVGSYRWAPDGSRIAFSMVEPATEQEEKDKKEKRDMVVVDEIKNASLYTVSLTQKDGKNANKIKRLTRSDFHVNNFTWSPDAKTIAFTHQINSAVDVWPTSDISTVPSDSGAVKSLVNGKGQDTSPLYSPDGLWIAYASDGGAVKWAGRSSIYVFAATGGTGRKLAATFDENPDVFAWTPDGKNLLVGEAYKTSRVIYSHPVDGKAPKMLTPAQGLYSGTSISKLGDLMSCIYQEPSLPPQIRVINLKDMTSKTLSKVNEEFAKRNHAKTEVINWKSKDGKYDIEGLVTYPANYQKGRRYPMILNIHGGPAGVFSQTYTGASGSYPLQAFAQDGYAVLRVNPRGSSGYGGEFRQANMNDWGFGDYDDIMGGVDKLIADGLAHADSLCVTGWSYGGYMTSMIITKTNRFKASMVGAGVTNLVSFTGTADIPGFIPDYFGGEMWDRTDVYMKHSAMFNIKNAKTPTLIIHGERDLRVPLSQGQELYGALKRLGVKTKMVTYPRTPHGPQEPKFILDIGERTMKWFNENLRTGLVKTASAN